jgi:threonine dehydrogenase-like Zn-dependent dehydrogenase
MKTAVFKTAGQPLLIETQPDPAPLPGEVVIKVARCGVCGSDIERTEIALGEMAYASGSIPGHEFSGEVVALGADVTRVKIGDRVAPIPVTGCGACAECLTGQPLWCAKMRTGGEAFAQYAVAGQHECLKLPEGVSFAQGALIEPLAVGLHGAVLAGLTPRARVLVIGAGPIALAATFWARRLGAGPVAVAAKTTRRRALAMRMGATSFLTASDDLAGQAAAALSGPPDVVFEVVGGPGMIAVAANCVRPRGTIIVLGACWVPDPWTPISGLFKEARIQFSMMYGMRDYELVGDVLQAGAPDLDAMITDTVSFDRFPAAFEALRTRTNQCKLMLDPWA